MTDESDSLDEMFSDALSEAAILPETKPGTHSSVLMRRPSEADLWRNVAFCAVFIRVTCLGCGNQSSIPEGYYVRRVHSRNGCSQLEKVHFVENAFPSLPHLVQTIDQESVFCSACLAESFREE